MRILDLLQQSKHKLLSLLIDPDKADTELLLQRIAAAEKAHVDLLLVGGSLITSGNMADKLSLIRQNTHIPIALFPGNSTHFHESADAILFLSLISGRNADLLIGNHVHIAAKIKNSGMEVIPTGYMLVESGKLTTAQYMSATLPIPSDKPDVAVATAIAGELLGLKCIYLDAGSGAQNTVPTSMVAAVKSQIDLPLIVGGGIRSMQQAQELALAGADLIVIGNAAEENPEIVNQMASLLHQIKR